jgi:hypothetical protein
MRTIHSAPLRPLIATCAAMALLLWALPAAAVQLGNPAPELKKGEIGLGLGISDHRTTALFDWGIMEQGVLRALAGTVDAGFKNNGTELGVGFRYTVLPKLDLGKLPARLGMLAQFQVATVDNSGLRYKTNIIDLGFGGSLTPVERLNAYGALVYERAQFDQNVPFFGKVAFTKSKLGALLGVEYWIGGSFDVGIEAHPGLFDDDLVVFGEFKF